MYESLVLCSPLFAMMIFGALDFSLPSPGHTQTGVLHTGTSSQRKLMMAGGLQRYGMKQSPACEVAMGTFLDLLRKHPSWTPKKVQHSQQLLIS